MIDKSTAKHLAFIASFILLFSCSKEDINNKPVASFNAVDEIDYFSLTSTSTDIDNDILTYEWISESELIDIENADSKDARFLIPELDKSIEIQIKHIVCDNSLCDSITPDNLGDFSELLPILDIGESLIVGDASLLPSRVKIDKPTIQPSSATINFWDEWNKEKSERGIEQAVEALRRQQK